MWDCVVGKIRKKIPERDINKEGKWQILGERRGGCGRGGSGTTMKES